MKHAPVTLEKTGDHVLITAFISFTGNYADKKPDGGSGRHTYAETAALALETKWSGDFTVYGRRMNAVTRVFSNSASPNKILKPAPDNGEQEFLKIKIIGGTVLSKIMRSHEKLNLSGIVKNDETITRWSVEKSSSPIVIYVTQNFQGSNPYKLIGKSSFEGLVAHEFGHALGLGDAYNAGYRGGKFPWTLDGFYAPREYEVNGGVGERHTVAVPDDDIMLCNGRVSDNDMRMVLEAYATGIQQFFPRRSKEWGAR